jgi:ketosteroid isomerase-like protein
LPPVTRRNPATADPQISEQVNALSKKYDEAVNNNDAAALAALYTEDAVLVTDVGLRYGRKAVEKWYTDTFQYLPKNHTSNPDQNSPHIIGTAGNEVWSAGEWGQIIPIQDGDPIQMKGYWGAIIVRDGDDWKFRMLTWNITPAPPAQTK